MIHIKKNQKDNLELSIYRYNSSISSYPYMKSYFFQMEKVKGKMLLDLLIQVKKKDPSFSFRMSCGQGVCGSDGMNINGRNGLSCITSVDWLIKRNKKIVIKPLTGFPILKDLIVDLSSFFNQYQKVLPYIIKDQKDIFDKRKNIQKVDSRNQLEGLYECILCACCSSSCPSFWWNEKKFLGPAAILVLYRFLLDDRDHGNDLRLRRLHDHFSVFKCHNIMNCVSFCPKKLNPNKAIRSVKIMLLKHIFKKINKKL
ncbi:succinate dehydrogenase iron-sulfur subunit [Candidatus Riesia pediculicola]|uniref:Succinate dehydrogenase iron-sulfur subunit n=1 Tax=Riesia pediculicola (strain USDA) TaxID=515618 RepID=D4G835_RIEPU|nr:succinate dehydrogenase iron-sulfur subunit [Candidatus Riesia pediculicola]ADD79481.1 succinate dehydrogenase iron-sulfur protein [Candidatus Riesia pediculicola USDA]ARC53740.1 succinate dehydrogenase [Candidatus Riesia pediculicola]QOJ86380.1 succinate dehydrogenase iron-sulfur subunit [Candidatus Riesia pediculicola]